MSTIAQSISGVAVTVNAEAAIAALEAQVADVTELQ